MSHAWATGALDGWVTGLAIVYLWASLPARRRRLEASPSALPTLLLRPCCGAEPRLMDCLTSSGLVNAPFPMRTRFAVASVADDAYATAKQVTAALHAAGVEAEVVLTAALGPNRKADQLARALSKVQADASVVIVADSDVDLEGVSLEALVTPLFGGQVAAIWVPPVEVAPRTVADRASAAILDTSIHAFRLLGRLDGAGMVGKLFAIRTDALEAVGGFASLTGVLGEDVELSRRLRALGLRVAVAPFAARSLACGRSWREAVDRYARWVSVVRSQRTLLLLAYPALFFATPLLLGASILAFFVDGPQALLPGVSALAARLALGVVARHRSGQPVRLSSLVPSVVLADVLLALAFVQALRARRVAWRGARLILARDGTMRVAG